MQRIREVAEDDDGEEHAFSTVHESIGREAEVNEIVGSAARRGDLVEVAVARCRARAHVGPRFRNRMGRRARELTPEEAAAVQEALVHIASDKIHQALGNTVPTDDADAGALAVASGGPAMLAADSAQVISTFTSLVGGLEGIANSWQTIVSAFKTTSSRTIVGEIEGKGFTNLKQSVNARQIQGLTPQGYDLLMPQLLRQAGIPPQYMQDAQLSVLLVQYADAQTWVKFDMLFEAGPGGQTQYVCVAGNRNANGSTNWVIASMAATFKLAPNARIIRTSKSVAGGIFEKTDDKIHYEDRSVTQEDINNVLGIMSGLVLEGMGNAIGVSLALPMPN